MSELNRLFDLLPHQKNKFPQEDMLACKEQDSWKKYSTQQVIDTVNQLSIGLLKTGLQTGDKVAIISNNRPEWNFMDLALLQIGCVNVPIYPTITEENFQFIFNDAGIKLAFVSDENLFTKVSNIKESVSTLENIFTFDKLTEKAQHWTDVLELGAQASNDLKEQLETKKKQVEGNQLATIIYTSGTTGQPKGVMLSHTNILSNVRSVSQILPLAENHRTLSFLPLCHIFERTVTYTYMYNGCSIYYAQSINSVGDDLKEVKPHYFSTVPRLLEKVYDKIIATGNELTGAKKKLFFWALDLGHKWDHKDQSVFYEVQLAIARQLVFKKWKEALGGEVLGILTAAAALQERLARVFNGAGIPVRQGYGMTETSPVLSIDRFDDDDAYIGSVGRPIPGIEVKIDPKSKEILARGPNIMMGYYNRPDATKEMIDEEGWLHTGDIGQFVDGKYLKITDRIKQLFKTSGGKYVAPQPIENKFCESPFIEQMMVTGNDQKFVGALFVPCEEILRQYCKQNNFGTANMPMKQMVQLSEVQKKFDEICKEYNVHFDKTETIKRFKILPNAWSIEGGELTPTLKVKRKVVMEKYQKEIEELYNV